MTRLSRWMLPLVALGVAWQALARVPVFPDVAEPEAYGRISLDSFTRAAGVPRVVFDHWPHRALYSCRLCHVDVGFAMERGASQISRATNASGLHCGACHDGKMLSRGKPVFAACSAEGRFDRERCGACHVDGNGSPQRGRYAEFIRDLPKYSGGYVDWHTAEGRGQILPVDYVEGVSIPRNPLRINRDVPMEVRGTWLGDVLFSHAKHAKWNGCEVCHPEIFPNTKRGSAKFSMSDIYAGGYCGVCHRSVAFPLAQCRRCHDTGARAQLTR